MIRLFSLRSLLLFALVVAGLYIFRDATYSPPPEPSPPYRGPEESMIQEAVNGFLSVPEAEKLCSQHRLPIYRSRSRPRRIYDLFLINTELDWLTLRLLELGRHVDHFVTLESPLTFQSTPKPLYLTNFLANPPMRIPPLSPTDLLLNLSSTPQFKEKVHITTLDHDRAPRTLLTRDKNDAWQQERYTRSALLSQALAALPNAFTPRIGDVILVGDIDEIPRPATLDVLRNCAFPAKTTLRSHFYYYSFQWAYRGEQWPHPQATFFAGIEETLDPETLRSAGTSRFPKRKWAGWGPRKHGSKGGETKADHEIYGAAWHCSSCYRTVEELQGKIGSFSHRGFNQEYFLDRERLVRHVRRGEDIFEREGEVVLDRVEGERDVPGVLREGEEGEGSGDVTADPWEGLRKVEGRQRWKFLLDRDGEGAGFEDV